MRFLAILCCLYLSASPFLFENGSNALADLGIDARIVAGEEKGNIFDSLQIVLSTEQHETGGIACFTIDQSDPQYIYVGFEDNIANETFVECFAIDETYQYTITFHTYGTYEIFSNRGMLFLYIVRGDWIISFDQSGKAVDVYELNADNRSGNDEVIESISGEGKYTVGGKTYEIGNDTQFSSSFHTTYSNLKVTEQDGTSHYLYYTDENQYWPSLIFFLVLIVVVIVIIPKHIDDAPPSRKE